MPTRAEILAATPKCPRMVYRQRTERCAQLCRYRPSDDWWICPQHGEVLLGAALGQAFAIERT